LIELLVSIAIIAVLAGLLVVAVSGSRGGTRDVRTRLVFQTLLAVADEYAVVTRSDREINDEGSDPLDWTASRPFTNHAMSGKGIPDDSSEKFVVGVMQMPETTELILNLSGNDVMVDIDGPSEGEGDGFFELRDAWGEKIEYCDSVPDTVPREVGKMHPSLFFASAGGDGEFGTEDDLYSFDFE